MMSEISDGNATVAPAHKKRAAPRMKLSSLSSTRWKSVIQTAPLADGRCDHSVRVVHARDPRRACPEVVGSRHAVEQDLRLESLTGFRPVPVGEDHDLAVQGLRDRNAL